MATPSIVNATSVQSATDASSRATPSYTPTPDRLLIAVIGYSVTSGTAVAPSSVSGNGLTWEWLFDVISGTNGITIYVAKTGTSPTTGAFTANWGATNIGQEIIIDEVDGTDLTGTGLNAIANSATFASTATSPKTLALGAAPSTASREWAAFQVAQSGQNEGVGANWTELVQVDHASPNRTLQTMWRSDAADQTSTTSGFASTIAVRGAILELKPGAAKPSVAAVTATANSPSELLKPSAGCATATAIAQSATITRASTPPADVASSTATANAPSESIKPSAGVASSTASALNAVASVPTDTNASAGVASSTATAHAATITLAGASGVASSTGAAGGATSTVQSPAGVASSNALANGVTAQVAVTSGVASSSGTANAPIASSALPAGAASSSGVANSATTQVATSIGVAATSASAGGPSSSVVPPADVALVSGAANDATATTLTATMVSAGVASSAAAANAPSIELANAAGLAQTSVTAGGPTSTVKAAAQPATAGASALNPTVISGTLGAPGVALVLSSALDPTVTIAPQAAPALIVGVAGDVQPALATPAGSAAVSGAAGGPTSSVAPIVAPALATGSAQAPTAKVAPTAAPALVTAAALNAQVVTATSLQADPAMVAALANGPTGSLRASGVASALGNALATNVTLSASTQVGFAPIHALALAASAGRRLGITFELDFTSFDMQLAFTPLTATLDEAGGDVTISVTG